MISITPQNKNLLFSIFLFLLLYYIRKRQSKSWLCYSKTTTNKKILEKCPTISKSTFKPTIYLQHKILQSILALKITPKLLDIEYNYEEVSMDKGGHTTLAWPRHKNKPLELTYNDILFVIIPGITGHATSLYVKDLIANLWKNKHRCVVYHGRLNGRKYVLPKEGYVNILNDFKHTIDYLVKKEPNIKLFGIGHSFGANLLVNYLGTYYKDNLFIGAVSLANPFNFILGENKARNSIANKAITGLITKTTLESKHHIAEEVRFGLNLEELQCYKSVRQLDHNFTIKIYGFESVDDYYWEISSSRRLKKVKVPVFLLQAEDDPIADANAFIKDEIERDCKNAILMMTKRGGHQGWIEGFFKLERWYMKPVLEFVNAVCSEYYDKISNEEKNCDSDESSFGSGESTEEDSDGNNFLSSIESL